MENKKFIQLYHTLTLNQKHEFVNSISLNKESKPQEIVIAKVLYDTNINTIELLQKACNANNKSIEAHRFEKLFNPLKRFLEEYIISNCLKEDCNAIDKLTALIEYLDSFNLYAQINSCILKGKKLKMEVQLSSEYRSMFRLERLLEILDKRNRGANLEDRTQEFQFLFDQSFRIERIKIAIEQLNRRNIINQNKEFIEEDLSDYIPFLKTNILLDIYVQIYAIIRGQGFSVKTYKEVLKKYQAIKITNAAFEDNQTIGLLCLNICIVAIRKQQDTFLPLLVKTVEMMEEKEALLERNTIEGDLYKIIISTLVNYDLKWVIAFIQRYEAKLIQYNGEDVKAYTKSLVQFAEGNFDKAHKTITEIKTTRYNDYMKLNLKKHLIKCLVETNWENRFGNSVIISNLSNMTKMISRAEILTKNQKIQFNNFVKYTSYISKIVNQKELMQKIMELKNLEFIQERNWVISLYNRK